MICKCVRCGKEFEVTHKTAVCKDCHTSVCIICGKEFELQYPYNAKTCSPKCRGKYRKISGIAKQSAKKAVATARKNNTIRSHVFHKVCKFCGKEFETTSPRRIYCGDDYLPCPVCGKLVKILDMSVGPKCCSEECRLKRIEDTCLEKYGNSNSVNSVHGRNKSRETCMSKYGVDAYQKTQEFRDKYNSTMQQRYGVNFPLQNASIRDKFISTCNKLYGGNSPMCNDSVKAKASTSAELHYGGFGLASDELRERIISTNIQKYGYAVPTQNPEIQSKVRETCRSKYGSNNFTASPQGIAKHMIDSSKLSEYLEFKKNPLDFIESRFDHTPSVAEICELVGVTDTPVYNILIDSNCRNLATFRESSMELEIQKLILNALPSCKLIKNCRNEITPYELDFYLPEYHFAVECNPTVTHNSSYKDPWGQDPKSSTYHSMKTDMCIDKGIQLFHIFGYEWHKSKDVIISMILNSLGKSRNRIYARNAYVCEVPYKECCEFLDTNHRQGSTSASVRLGLRTKSDNRLVSVMTFNHTRSTIGKKFDYDENEWELSRFCSLLNTCVVGGASKLFKYFRNNYTYSKIISFSDRAHTSGKLYSVLGFQYVSTSSPSYVWVDMMNDSYLTRVACQKRNLRKLFDDESIDIENQTERQIMMDHGYGQVFDSGVIRWEFADASL